MIPELEVYIRPSSRDNFSLSPPLLSDRRQNAPTAKAITSPNTPQLTAAERTARPVYGVKVLEGALGLKPVVELVPGEVELEEISQTGEKLRPPLGAQ